MTVIRANAVLDSVSVTNATTAHRVELCRELVDDIGRYHHQRKASKRRIATAVAASQTSLTEIFGVGPICAGAIIGYTGDIARFASRHHHASYNATAPIDASSATKNRHRLNPRGNRRLSDVVYRHLVADAKACNPIS